MLAEADKNNVVAKEKPLRASKGRIKGNRIAINNKMTEIEKKCIMAEELGHYYTGIGDIIDQSDIVNRKQELSGRIHAYNRLIGLTGIVNSYKHGCRSLSDAAEYLDVTEEFLTEAIQYYRSKYGHFATLDNYIIYFEPALGVFELV
ncbi:MAG: ImmA/IrrE family metallo-endopeptidase [Lachnospiraceae bacterium]